MIGNVIQSRYLVLDRLPDSGGALVPADGGRAHARVIWYKSRARESLTGAEAR